MELSSPAKINLWLEVLERRPDGYHNIVTLMRRISLMDLITIEPALSLEVNCSHSAVPSGPENLAYRAANLLFQRTGYRKGVSIEIQKHIPVSAGLGGGSSNAAATLKGLNELLAFGLSQKELMEIGLQVGADVPFFLFERDALASGVGEKLEEVSPLPPMWLVLLNPPIQVSTSWAYQSLGFQLTRNDINVTRTKSPEPTESIIKNLRNDLEQVVLDRYPQLRALKEILLAEGAGAASMSGSGSTMFGVFWSQEEAHRAWERLSCKGDWEAFLAHTLFDQS